MTKYTSQWAWEGMNDSEFVCWLADYVRLIDASEELAVRIERLSNNIAFCIFNDESNAVIFAASDEEAK